MSYLNDPRVLFAAERTVLAWSRTAAGLIALGFLIDRASMIVGNVSGGSMFYVWIGVAFILLGSVLSALSVVQFRRAVRGLQPAEIPDRYFVNLAGASNALIAALGLALAIYLALSAR